MEREVGGGIGMGNTCKPLAVSFQCMTKSTTNKKKKKKKKTQAELSPFSKVKELLTTMTKCLDTLNLKLFSQPFCPSNQLPSQPPAIIAGLDPPRADMQRGLRLPHRHYL